VPYQPLPVSSFNFSLVSPVGIAATVYNVTDSLRISYLGEDLSVVEGPVQLGAYDGSHYIFNDGSFSAPGELGVFYETPFASWTTTSPVVGFTISHVDPGSALPFWFATGFPFARVTDVAVFGTETPGTTPKTPIYESGTTWWQGQHLDNPFYEPKYGLTTDYFVNFLHAAFAGSPSPPGWMPYPNGIAGALASIDSGWVSSLAPTIVPWPFPAGAYSLNSTVPLGDLTVVFLRATARRSMLRQRQGPRGGSPRVSWGRM
jgi:hypothetical protein